MGCRDSKTAGLWRAKSPLATLVALALLLACTYAALALLSFCFGPNSEHAERPLLAILGLLGFAFLLYGVSIFIALRAQDNKSLLAVIVLASIAFRVVSLYSWPIQEIDIYRYIWDGNVVRQGISPYRFSPKQVLSESADSPLPDDLRRLIELRENNTAVGTIVSRVHYNELPTIYPPVSQAVFAMAVFLTPTNASVLEHIVVMKIAFVFFDLGTLFVVLGLLRLTRKHVGWSVAYAWCPLVLKEIANTGHLDSLTVFLTTLALWFAVKSLSRDRPLRSVRIDTMLAALFLALAVGAKLYPIVLAPLFLAIWIRGQGWRWALAATTFCFITTAILVCPMFLKPMTDRNSNSPHAGKWPSTGVQKHLKPMTDRNSNSPHAGLAKPTLDKEQTIASPDELLPPPPDTSSISPQEATDSEPSIAPQDPSRGLRAFLQHWEMNDFLFLLAIENFRPVAHSKPDQKAWFSIVPETWKEFLLSGPSQWLQIEPTEAAFLLARLLTLLVFVLLTASLLWRARYSFEPAVWLRVAFLMLGWFWLLSPTQNPWYWTWALPLVVFAKSRAWLAMSGLVMIYYFRFWLIYHCSSQTVLGTHYTGAAFFDLVVTWIEFGPWFVWLLWETLRPARSSY